MASGSGHFEGTLDVGLSFDVGEVLFVRRLSFVAFRRFVDIGWDGCVAVQKIDHLLQGTGGYRFQSFGHGCFGGVLPW